MLERWLRTVCEKRWLKAIDKGFDKYLKLKTKLDIQWGWVNVMMDKYKERFGVDLRERGAGK